MMPLTRILRKLPLAIGVASGLILVIMMGWASFAENAERLAQGPVMAAASAGLVVSLLFYLAELLRHPVRSVRYWGLVLLHAGLAALFSGLMLNETFGSRGFVFLPEKGSTHFFVGYDEKDYPLPFEITLRDFSVRAYADTMRVRDYVSQVVIDGKDYTIAVNAPVTVSGFEFFQHDCGFEAAAGHPFAVLLKVDGIEKVIRVRMGENFLVGNRFMGVVRDFLPSASRAETDAGKGTHDGSVVMTTGRDVILNPAFLVELENDFGDKRVQWVFPEEPKTAVFDISDAAADGEGASVEILPQSFPGVEYTVLSVVRTPFNPLIFAGVILACIGMLFFYVFGRSRA